MRRFFVTLLALLFAASPVDAGTLLLLGAGVATPAAPAGYTGPGDVVSGATAWHSCVRGYSAAYSTGSNNGCNLRRASDNAAQDIVILSNGNFDVASANSFAGTDATCQGSTSGLSTTIAFTSCSATPKAADTVTGSGISQPEYLTACGSFVGGAGSCTLTTAQNIGVAETVTMQVALFVTKAYDQSGSNACTSAPCNAAQATAGNQPQWLPNCFNALPCVIGNGSSQRLISVTFTALAVPGTYSVVSQVNAARSSFATIYAAGDSGGGGWTYQAWNSANQQGLAGSGNITVTSITDGIPHPAQGLVNGASSILNIDGTDHTGTVGNANSDTSIGILSTKDNSNLLNGWFMEGGLWPSGFSGTQRTNVCHNEFSYYATGTSC